MRSFISYIFLSILMVACSSGNCLLDEPATVIEYQYSEHNQWIYSQMNKYYLWRDELPDSVSCDYGLTPPEFFKSILSTKDRFSYITANSSYNPQFCNYGVEYQVYVDKRGNEAAQVLYVQSDNAKQQGLKRGEFFRIIERRADYLRLCKVILNEQNLFVSSDKEIDLPNTADKQGVTVLLDSVYYLYGHKIGYLCYTKFDKESDLHHSLTKFKDKHITELILDLRYNPGGYVSTCQYLCNCIVSENGYGNVFQQCVYNDVLSNYYFKTTGNERTFSFFANPITSGANTLGVGIIALNLPKVYILTSSHTASASEATIICLKPYTDVTVIGETTVGKGVGSRNFSDNKYKYSLQPIIMRYYNAIGVTTPDSGIVPDYYIPDGYATLKKDIGDIEEPLLRSALDIICGIDLPIINKESRASNFEDCLTPVGEPSYVTVFKNKHYNESN